MLAGEMEWKLTRRLEGRDWWMERMEEGKETSEGEA